MEENVYLFEDDIDPINGSIVRACDSPDITVMFPIVRGTATFYYKTEEHRTAAIAAFEIIDKDKPKPRLPPEQMLEWIEKCGITCGSCLQIYERSSHFRCGDERNRDGKSFDRPVLKKTKACEYYFEQDKKIQKFR